MPNGTSVFTKKCLTFLMSREDRFHQQTLQIVGNQPFLDQCFSGSKNLFTLRKQWVVPSGQSSLYPCLAQRGARPEAFAQNHNRFRSRRTGQKDRSLKHTKIRRTWISANLKYFTRSSSSWKGVSPVGKKHFLWLRSLQWSPCILLLVRARSFLKDGNSNLEPSKLDWPSHSTELQNPPHLFPWTIRQNSLKTQKHCVFDSMSGTLSPFSGTFGSRLFSKSQCFLTGSVKTLVRKVVVYFLELMVRQFPQKQVLVEYIERKPTLEKMKSSSLAVAKSLAKSSTHVRIFR